MRNLSEQEIEEISGAGPGGDVTVIAGAAGVSAGLATAGLGIALAGTGPIGWAIAAGILVGGATTGGLLNYYNTVA